MCILIPHSVLAGDARNTFDDGLTIGAIWAYDEICRGSNEPNSQTTKSACTRRNELADILSDDGWCYDRLDGIIDWRKCTKPAVQD